MADTRCQTVMYCAAESEGWNTWRCSEEGPHEIHSFKRDESAPLIRELKPVPGRTLMQVTANVARKEIELVEV